jgi:hypothetical protein
MCCAERQPPSEGFLVKAHRFGIGAVIAALAISAAAGWPAMASAALRQAPASPASGWRTVSGLAIPSSESANLTALTMARPSLGWAAGFTLDNTKQNAPFEPLLAAWNGRTWRQVPMKLDTAGRLDGLAAQSARNAWAVGTTYPSNDASEPLTLHWNGHQWARVPAAGVPGFAYISLIGVAVRSATDAWAVGEAQAPSSQRLRPVIEHWDGRHWKLMANPKVQAETALSAVTVASNGQAWAVGTPFTNSRRGIVLHWTGRSWVTAATPATSTAVVLDGVTLAGHKVWAVGSASDANGNWTPYAIRWQGGCWTMMKVPAVAGGQFESVIPFGHGQLMAVGEAIRGALYGLWNGRSWAAATNSKLAQLDAIASDHSHVVWAVGSVTTSPTSFRPVVQVSR